MRTTLLQSEVAMTTLIDITNFYQINDRLATSGQPDREQLKAISNAGFELVINLALHDSPCAIADEQQLFVALGVGYIHIPVDFHHPDMISLQTFFSTMQQHQDCKTLVHCVINWRVASFMFLHHIINCGMLRNEAQQHFDAVWQPDQVWQNFIAHALTTYGLEDKR